MMRYEDKNGTLFEGRNPKDVVRAMASTKLTKPSDRDSYRKAVARRVKEMSDLQIETESDKVFLSSLVEHGILTVRP